MEKELPADWQKRSADHQKKYKQFLQKPYRKKVLEQLPELHATAFETIDCLQCGACCKNYSPRFKTPDIKRIARYLKMKEGVFIATYLRLDNDGDYVARQAPCPFLGADNYCGIYEERPSDCHRFPYTDEDVLIDRPQITLKNTSFCPITFYVMEALLLQAKQQ